MFRNYNLTPSRRFFFFFADPVLWVENLELGPQNKLEMVTEEGQKMMSVPLKISVSWMVVSRAALRKVIIAT